jgi:hypothetical protein
MNVTLGGMFQITCEPRGVPYPFVSWRHNGQTVTNTDNSKRRLIVEVKHYTMAGYIECIGNNGVGEPASSGLLLLVHCKQSIRECIVNESHVLLSRAVVPEVIVEQPIVHTKGGLEAKLECIVFSHPTAQIHWFHNGKPLIKINNHIATKDNDLVSSKAHMLIAL